MLRWRDPRAGIPMVMRLYAAGEYTVFLDGQPPPSARSIIPFGEHVFGFTVSGVDPTYMVLMFAAANEPPGRGASRTDDPVSVMTADDGTWRYTIGEPADDGWLRPGFDDSGWQGMRIEQERRPPDDPKRDPDRYRVRRLEQSGAVGLGVAPGTVKVWIRREFTLTPPTAGADS